LTLPFFFINQNPLFVANIWYLLSAFFAGLFMYLLARYLSKSNQPISILSGLVFEFAPTKITSMDHLQNLSIFYLPLIILLLLKYRDTGSKKYLAGFALASSLLFLASWYQMVFGLVVILLFLVFVLLSSRRRGGFLVLATFVAIVTTLPLAKEYIRFSKSSKATFSISNQVQFSSSADDYLTPYQGTPLGSLYYKLRPNVQRNSHNPDNYSYAGITLYAVLALSLLGALGWRYKKKRLSELRHNKSLIILLSLVFIVGFIFSLGPLVKIGSRSVFSMQSLNVVIPAPYILVDKLLPQLSFIRAAGRASVIVLFALCCLLAVFARQIDKLPPPKKRNTILVMLVLLVSLDVLPLKNLLTTPFQPIAPYKVSYTVPAVYKRIKDDKSINDIIILRTQKDYSYATLPIAQAEDVLWAGYHNKNIFNGYSGYQPPEYAPTLQDFTDLQPNDIVKMKALGLRYVLIDKQLSNKQLPQEATTIFPTKVYEDSRYILYKI
jgi:hypothetical protein